MHIRRATSADSAAIGRVQLGSWHYMLAPIVPVGYLEQFSESERAEGWHELLAAGEDIVYCAENEDGEVIGYICARPATYQDYNLEVTTFHILPAYHKQGIGRQLFNAMATHLYEAGYRNLFLWVLADNPSRAFYERLGGRYLGEQTITLGNKEVGEIAYGWDDLQPFLG